MSSVHTLYLIHHSHTDIGFTHDQPIVWDLHGRFIEQALDLAEQWAGSQSDGAFRWTVENTGVLLHWLERASSNDVERLIRLERAGRIEVTAMFANVTPLYDIDQLIESCQPVRRLRDEYGFTIRYAMNCDVNGENWPLVDILLDLGIQAFSMAINTHFGAAPLHRPNAFWWQGPSGRKLLVWNGWSYDEGWRFHIGRDAQVFEQTWWPRIVRRLEQVDYPLPVLMAQSFHPFGDNGPAFDGFSRFMDEWNGQGKSPRLVMATPSLWWSAVLPYAHQLPSHRGDWTDYWNFGCGSSAREQSLNRVSRVRLRAADALAASVLSGSNRAASNRTARSFALHRHNAWHALNLWDEHTWGADVAIRVPGHSDSAAQWHHKANYAYTARSLSLLLQRDALADFATRVDRNQPSDLLLFNPLPWPRVIAGEVPAAVVSPRGVPTDASAGRHFQDRMVGERHLGQTAEARFLLAPTRVPGFGYTVVARSDLVEEPAHDAAAVKSESVRLENQRYRLTIDGLRGGIRSCYDKQLEWEWVDQAINYRFNGYVHESVAGRTDPSPRNLLYEMQWQWPDVERPDGWKPGWPALRAQAGDVLFQGVYHTALGDQVVQHLRAPGCTGLLRQSIFLPNFADYIECEAEWEMGLEVHPEATYLVFPFNLPNATARFDLGGQAVVAGADQLPGVCRDYFTAQHWVDFSDERRGVTVALPENPMVQLGDFHFGHHQREFKLERAMLLGWITNNYWETNFRAHQPGTVRARYRIRPHHGPFDEAAAHRFGSESANAQPLFQHLGEPPSPTASDRGPGEPPERQVLLPISGALLGFPDAPVLTLHIRPAQPGPGIVVRLLNASDAERRAEIRSELLHITAAQLCDLLDKPVETLNVEDGRVTFGIPPRRAIVVHLTVEWATQSERVSL